MSTVRSVYAQSVLAILATPAISAGFQGVASAHPGHGITPDGNAPAHFLVEPAHGTSIAIILIAAFAATYVIRYRATVIGQQSDN